MKRPQPPPRFGRAAAKTPYGCHRAIAGKPVEQRDRRPQRVHAARRPPGHTRARGPRHRQELAQSCVDSRTDRACRIVLFEQQARGHDHVGVHRPQRHAKRGCDGAAPCRDLPQRVLVGDDECRPHLRRERIDAVLGKPPQHEAGAAAPQPLGQIAQPVHQELVVAQVGAFDERVQAEERRRPGGRARCRPQWPRRGPDCPPPAARAASSRRRSGRRDRGARRGGRARADWIPARQTWLRSISSLGCGCR